MPPANKDLLLQRTDSLRDNTTRRRNAIYCIANNREIAEHSLRDNTTQHL